MHFDVGWVYRNWGDKGVIVLGRSGAVAPGSSELAWVWACALQVTTRDMVQSIWCFCFWQRVYTVTSGSDPRRTHNVDSDRCPKWSRTSEDDSE